MPVNWKQEYKPLLLIVAGFLLFYFLPLSSPRLQNGIFEALALTKWYAREHVILCLVPAFFLAGGIAVFLSQASVMKYLGASAPKAVAYGVASVSGTVLAVCSCTVLPLFAGIYRMGAGLGPASAFLYSGPAINVLAIILTASVLGWQLGVARALGAILFSVVLGLLMHAMFRKEENERHAQQMQTPDAPDNTGNFRQNMVLFASMIGILVFANWGEPQKTDGLWWQIYSNKWLITSLWAVLFTIVLTIRFNLPKWRVGLAGAGVAALAIAFPERPIVPFSAAFIALSLLIGFRDDVGGEWFEQSWSFAKQIMPLLFVGVLIAGLLLGRPGNEALFPSEWISQSVGGNSLRANFIASLAGAFMYFATLTEIPILQGLIGAGMGKGPALALLLAGPALSLPNMLVIRSVLGTKKTVAFCSLVVVMATVSGVIYGAIFA